jgi:hypothetical protein
MCVRPDVTLPCVGLCKANGGHIGPPLRDWMDFLYRVRLLPVLDGIAQGFVGLVHCLGEEL